MILFLSMLALSSGAAAQQPPSAPAAAPAAVQAPKSSKPRMICVTDPTTGSMLPKKTCHTQEDWDAANRDGRAQAEELRREQELLQTHQH